MGNVPYACAYICGKPHGSYCDGIRRKSQPARTSVRQCYESMRLLLAIQLLGQVSSNCENKGS
eukprot:5721065-Amphidinium_carterae.1